MKTTFQEVKARKQVITKCKGCGKRLVRIVSVSQTINPFNKNKKGIPKTFTEIREELGILLKKKGDIVLKGIFCSNCK